jgi:hypothetical protein
MQRCDNRHSQFAQECQPLIQRPRAHHEPGGRVRCQYLEIPQVAETAALINRALRRVRIRFRQPVETGSLASIPGVRLLEQDERRGVVVQVEGEMDALIKALAAFPVSDFETERPSLEEIFLAYYADGEAK